LVQQGECQSGAGGLRPRIRTERILLLPWSIMGSMSNEYDPEGEAKAAMKRAAASEGADRERFIRLALAWLRLARERDAKRSV
jgi:hypothetical protein